MTVKRLYSGVFIKRLECNSCGKIIHTRGWGLLDGRTGDRIDDRCPRCGGKEVTWLSDYLMKDQTTL